MKQRQKPKPPSNLLKLCKFTQGKIYTKKNVSHTAKEVGHTKLDLQTH